MPASVPFNLTGDGLAEGPEHAYPLSPLQQGMLFHWQLDRHSGTDIGQVVADLHETIDVERLHEAWRVAFATFRALHTTFRWENLPQPVQFIDAAYELPFVYEDLRHLPADKVEAYTNDFLYRDRHDGFDLANAPAMRIHLFQIGDAHFRLAWSLHHIILDGRAIAAILNSVFGDYDDAPVPSPDRPFRDYVEWIGDQDNAPARAYWREKLAGFSAPTPLPSDRTSTSTHYNYAHRWAHLSLDVSNRLRELAKREKLTLNTIVMGAWGLMLSRYSGEQDIVFGATKTTRRGTIDGAESATGVFLATLPVRLKADPDISILQYLRHVRDEWVSMRGSEHLPLVEIRQASDVPTSRMFDTLLVFENFQFGTMLKAQGGKWSSRRVTIAQQSGFPLALMGYADDELALKLEFDQNKFSGELADFIIGHLVTLLHQWADDTVSPLWGSNMLSAAEHKAVVYDWNKSATEYPRDAFIDELFAEQATLRPDAIAVECNGVSLTYGQLDARASVLAARIVGAGVSPDEAVVLYADRSLEFVVACLAILKAGAAYLPIEPGYPKDRLLYMIADANARVVVASNELLSQITEFVADAPTQMRVLGINANAGDTTQPIQGVLPSSTSAASRVAYIMYTSGSSGQPKGVAVPHRGAVRLVRNTTYMDFTSNDAMLCLATTMFDLSTWEIWSALLNGGRLVVLPAGPPDPAVIANLIERAGVTMLWNTPALFQQLVDFGLKQHKSVRLFAIAGDIVPVPHLRRAVEALPKCQFVNGYGPTENSVFTCAYRVPMDMPVEDPLPIGPPLSNTQAYVLDAHGAPTPVGVAGELFTGGDGVAIRYVNRPELTAERFVRDPFSTQSDATMYRTGDAARWRADGVVEFLGRLDNQVKIRGYRIEPGEVEAVMCALPGIRTAAVAVRKDSSGQKRLLGYYVVEENRNISPADMRTALRGLLPDYMVPAAIMQLDELPQTNSGKIDRKALPEPSSEGAGDVEINFRSRPLGRSQRQIALIWEELLNHRPIGADDDFFEIGGHSLLATRMIAEVERVLGRRLALATLLEKPTIRHLAQRVDLDLLEDPEPSTVVLNAEGKERPFVFVHGDLTGGGWYCRKLSTLIGSDTPMIVMPTFRPPASGDPLTIEQMASMHVQELRKVQPAGPYRVGGFCAGGLIALGIAHQLTAMGEKVEQLVLVDSVNKNAPVSRWRAVIDRIAPPSETKEAFVKRQATMKKAQYYDARLRVIGAMGPGKLAKWAINTVRIRLPGGRVRASEGAISAQETDSKPVVNVRAQREKLLFYLRSQTVFIPRRYAGPVELVFSSDPSDQSTNATDPAAAAAAIERGYEEFARTWDSVLPAARIHHIPGTHVGLIVENLDKLGVRLRSFLTPKSSNDTSVRD